MNTIKKSSRIIPSTRVSILVFEPSRSEVLPIVSRTSAESITSGISVVRILFEIRIGRTRDVIPIMAHTLKILLPTTLPIASPAFPSTADITLITSSGRRGAERHDCESDNKIRHSPPLGKRRRAIGKRVCSHKNQHKTQYEEILYSES